MATNLSSVFALSISLAVALLCTIDSAQSFANAHSGGFSVDLIHRDSPSSPFYNPGETASERAGNAVRRSASRVHYVSNTLGAAPWAPISPPDVVAPLIANDFEYLMNISIGSPPFPILAIADTGSDIIWTQCQPCTHCYKQDAPVFDPRLSSTYRPVSCSSRACTSLSGDGSFCSRGGDICQYQVTYGDSSHTSGDLATETLALGSTTGTHVAFPNTLFGCGHDNTGSFDPEWAGIVGLGAGPASLINQLGPFIGRKFSYCMVPYIDRLNRTTSTMHFGQNAALSGPDVVSTPLMSSDSESDYYFLQLEFVSVGRTIIPFEGSSFGSSGNIIIDSGTVLTLVPTRFLSEFSTAIEAQVTGGNKTSDPEGLLSLCYELSSNLEIPTVTMRFKGGDVVLNPTNIFVPMSDTVICLAFMGSDEVSIYGNLAQQDFMIGYDLEKHTLSFKPADCSKN